MPSTPPNTSKTALFVECLLVVVVFHAAWAVAYGFLPGLRWALWVGYFLVQCFTALVLSACFHAHALQQHRYWPYLLAGLLPPAAMCGVMGLIDMRLASWATTYALGGVLFLVAFALIRWTHGHPRKHALQTAQSQRSERVRVRAKQSTSHLGKTGHVVCALSPTGVIEVDGERMDAISERAYLDPGTLIQIIGDSRGLAVVRPHAGSDEVGG